MHVWVILPAMKPLSQLLLLVQSQSDVDALPAAAEAIRAQGYDGLWVLFSPAVLVDTAAASAQHDRDVAALNAQIDQCAKVRDFAGAQSYQVQLDAAILEKSVKTKESWKTMTAAQQEEAKVRVFDAFFAAKPAPNIRPEMMHEHYSNSEFIAALNAHKKAWFTPYTPGSFVLAWPTSFVEKAGLPAALRARLPDADSIKQALTQAAQETVVKPERKPLPTQHKRFKELVAMGIDGLGQHAIALGINPNQHKRIIGLRHAVFKKEMEMGKIVA